MRVTNQENKFFVKRSQYVRIKNLSNLKIPACASKRDVLELATLRYLMCKYIMKIQAIKKGCSWTCLDRMMGCQNPGPKPSRGGWIGLLLQKAEIAIFRKNFPPLFRHSFSSSVQAQEVRYLFSSGKKAGAFACHLSFHQSNMVPLYAGCCIKHNTIG